MKTYTKESLEHLQSKINLLQLLEGFEEVTMQQQYVVGKCPFCEGLQFMINREQTRYYCFDCGAEGDSVDYLMNAHKLRFDEAIEFLGKVFDIKLQGSEERKPSKCYSNLPQSFLKIVKEIDTPIIIHALLECAHLALNNNKLGVNDVQQEKKEEKGVKNTKRANRKAKKNAKPSGV